MTDGLRKSHLRKAPQVGLSEVGLPDIYLCKWLVLPDDHFQRLDPPEDHLQEAGSSV